jgi:acetoin utilization protein AcuB
VNPTYGLDLNAVPAEEVESVRVRDLMSAPVLSVDVNETLWDAWQLMFVSGLHHLLVLDERECVGVVSDRTVLTDLPLTPEHLSHRTIREVIGVRSIVVVHPWTTVTGAARALARYSVDAVPVLDIDQRPVGIMTTHDIVRHLAQMKDIA